MKIEIGPMCKPINEQLGGKLNKTDSVLLERDHRDISRLYARGYLSESAFSTCGKHLIKRVQQAVANTGRQVRREMKEGNS